MRKKAVGAWFDIQNAKGETPTPAGQNRLLTVRRRGTRHKLSYLSQDGRMTR